MSGSKPPSSRHVRIVISSQPVPACPVDHAAPASVASGTASGCAQRQRMVRGQHDVERVAAEVLAVHAGRPRMRLVLPLVGQHEIDVAERQRGQRLLGLGLDELAAQLGRRAGEVPDRGHGEAERDGLEGGDARRGPATRPAAAAASSASARSARSSSALGVPDEDQRGVREAYAAARALQQRDTGLALEHGQLLGDGGRREAERIGDRGDRAARVELVQQAQPPEVEHR